MKFHSEQSLKQLHPELVTLLVELRERRAFDPCAYVAAKTYALNAYLRTFKLTTCVIAVSGGIDSAVTLAIADVAKKQPGSPITQIVPLALPVFKGEYTTNQEAATRRGEELMEKFGVKRHTIDLTQAYLELKKAVDTSIGTEGAPWAAGQLVSYLRTPTIYYVTSLMSQQEQPSIVCGTTNRDEGAYLGYFGKASDGMVDLQLISDLHKSEVRSVAQYLQVPESIIAAVPTGDMFDGRVDEEVFGAGYDFVELYLLLKSFEQEYDRAAYLDKLSEVAKEQYEVLASRLEDLHRYNGHKYLARSPAYHLDVLESGVPGGWPNGYEKVDAEPRGKEFFVNAFTFSDMLWPDFYKHTTQSTVRRLELPKGEGVSLTEVLLPDERKELLSQANTHGWKPVGIDGYASHYKEGDKIGSYRASSFSPALAGLIWKRIARFVPSPRVMAEDTPTDWDGHHVWRAIGISPLFRFIKYTSGGLLVPHFDGPFTYPNGQKTLMSIVVYLNTENVTGGFTRFIRDPHIDTPLAEKDHSDWSRFAREDEVLFRIDPEPGAAIVFDHRILHDALEISGEGEKIIIRSDIVFTKCGLE